MDSQLKKYYKNYEFSQSYLKIEKRSYSEHDAHGHTDGEQREQQRGQREVDHGLAASTVVHVPDAVYCVVHADYKHLHR